MKRDSKALADERREAQQKRNAALKERNKGRASRLAAAMQLADSGESFTKSRKREYS